MLLLLLLALLLMADTAFACVRTYDSGVLPPAAPTSTELFYVYVRTH